jgi:hypothetical protein
MTINELTVIIFVNTVIRKRFDHHFAIAKNKLFLCAHCALCGEKNTTLASQQKRIGL